MHPCAAAGRPHPGPPRQAQATPPRGRRPRCRTTPARTAGTGPRAAAAGPAAVRRAVRARAPAGPARGAAQPPGARRGLSAGSNRTGTPSVPAQPGSGRPWGWDRQSAALRPAAPCPACSTRTGRPALARAPAGPGAPATGREPLDRGDRPARYVGELGMAGHHRGTIHERRAGTAFPFAAARLHAGQAKIGPQQRQQASRRRPGQLTRLAVHHGTGHRRSLARKPSGIHAHDRTPAPAETGGRAQA